MWHLTNSRLWHWAELQRAPHTWTHITASHHNFLCHHPTKHIIELIQCNNIQFSFSHGAVFLHRFFQWWLSSSALPTVILPKPQWWQAGRCTEPEGSCTDFADEATVLLSYALRRQQSLKLPLSLAKKCHYRSICNMLRQLPTWKLHK